MEFYQDLILTAVISLIIVFLLGKLAATPADVTVAVTPATAADGGGSSRGSRTPRIGGKRVSFRDPIESGGVESVSAKESVEIGVESVPARESVEIGVESVDEKSVTELQWVRGLESEIIESWKGLVDSDVGELSGSSSWGGDVDEALVEGELVIESPESSNEVRIEGELADLGVLGGELMNEDRLEELLIESVESKDVVNADEVNEAGLVGELAPILTSISERNTEVNVFEGNEAGSEGDLVIGLPEMGVGEKFDAVSGRDVVNVDIVELPDSSEVVSELEIDLESRGRDASQASEDGAEGELTAESASVMAGEIVVASGPELEPVRSVEEVRKNEFEDQIGGEESREGEALQVNEARVGGGLVIELLETEKFAESSRQLVEEFPESGDEVKIDESGQGEERGGDERVGSLLQGEDEWEGIERSEPEKLFAVAASYTSSAIGSEEVSRLSSEVQMQLYGLHKVATEGPCYEAQPMALKVSSRAKWHAWQRLGNMNPELAMEHYISLLTRSIPGWIVTKPEGTTTQGVDDPPEDRVVGSGTPDSGMAFHSEPSSLIIRESKEKIIADSSFDGSTPSWQGSK